MRSFKSNENIHKKEGGSYYEVSANKASSVTLQSPGNESQKKSMETLSCHSNESSWAMTIKNTIYVEAYVMDMYAKFQLHTPYGF